MRRGLFRLVSAACAACRLIYELLFEVGAEVLDGDAHLRHGVALAHGDCAVLEGVEVHRHAVRRADLVLAAVAFADGARAVEVAHEVFAELRIDLLRLVGELFLQRQHRDLDGRDGGMEVQHHSRVALADLFLRIGVAKEREHHAFHAEGGLDDVGHILLVGDGVGVGEVLAACVDVLGEVVVRAVGDAPKLSPAEREEELEVGRRFGVEAQLFRAVVAQAEFAVVEAEPEQPFVAEFAPIGEPLEVGAGLAEELQLHLLELAHAEDEVAGRDLVAEGFAYLPYAERHALSRGALDVLEVDEYALRGLGTEIDGVRRVLGDALEGLEHQVELAYGGEIRLAAHGADDAFLLDVVLHLPVRPAGDGAVDALLLHVVLNEVVRTVARLAGLAVHERIGKAAYMPRRLPHGRVHKYGAVHADVVRAFGDEFLPPRRFDVVFERDAERTVVPGVGESAVYLAAGEDESAVFAQRDKFVHSKFSHIEPPFRLSFTIFYDLSLRDKII